MQGLILIAINTRHYANSCSVVHVEHDTIMPIALGTKLLQISIEHILKCYLIYNILRVLKTRI